MKRPWSRPKILIAVLDFCALSDSCVRASHFRHRNYSHTVLPSFIAFKKPNNLRRNGSTMKRPWSCPKNLIAVLDFCALPDSCVRASHFRHRHYSHTVAGRCRHAWCVEWCWLYHSYTCLVVRISDSTFAISSTIDSSIMPLNKTSTTHSKSVQ